MPNRYASCYLAGKFQVHSGGFLFPNWQRSETAQGFDASCMAFGDLLSRQRNRDMPNTCFPNGIRRGKMNGKRFTGVLVCLYGAICSEQGQRLLQHTAKWREPGKIEDWILLLETLLQWEAWLKSDNKDGHK